MNDTKGRRITGIGLCLTRLISNSQTVPLVLDQLSKFTACVSI
jgi:hypothetical protein